MKKLTLFLILLQSIITLAQAPQKMSYQSVVRNASNQVLANQSIGVKISILEGSLTGTTVYSETHTATTNSNGLFTLETGGGIPTTGTFSAINWGNGSHYIKSEIDVTGGTNYALSGTMELLSVPYALYAATAGNVQSGTVATVQTNAISELNVQQVKLNGDLTNNGGKVILAKGFCYSTTPNPTEANATVVPGNNLGTFAYTAMELLPSTTYYVRAFAASISGTGYGQEVSFTTLAVSAPTVSTGSVAAVSSSSATATGVLTQTGGSSVTAAGFCWSTTPNPTLADSNLTVGPVSADFISTISDLTANTTYYLRAYATNAEGTAYGNEQVFTTTSIQLASLGSTTVSDILYTTATSTSQVRSDGGTTVTQRGFCWSTKTNPTTDNFKAAIESGTGSYSTTLTGLVPNTTYYIRSYIINANGTFYGEQQTFTTLEPSGLYIGKKYAGGIIFYLDATGNHGMVCAESDQGSAPWGCRGAVINTSTDFASGAANTAAIIEGCNELNTAAFLCDDLILNSYSDWYLPSSDELGLMLDNLYVNGIGNFNDSSNYYWSSSEFEYPSVENASSYYLGGPEYYSLYGLVKSGRYKDDNGSIRAVRSF